MRSIAGFFWNALQNLFWLALVVGLATTVWVIAVVEEDPFEERAFQRTIPIQFVGLADDMLLIQAQQTEAAITLRAPTSTWDTLVASQLSITADLSALGPGMHRVTLVGAVDNDDTRVVGIKPGVIEVVLEREITREAAINLRVSGEPAVGYAASTPRLTPEVATITGPESLVESVSEVTGSISLNNLRDSLTQDVTLRAVDSEGRTVAGLTVAPEQARVAVSVRQLGGYRDVAIRANLDGQVAAGYRITNITTAPAVVTVFAENPQLVEALPGFVETEPLDITGASANIAASLPLALPDGISLVGDQSVQVNITIEPLVSSLLLEPEIEVAGLLPEFAAVVSPETLVVIVSGPAPVLDTLDTNDVRVIVDLLGLEPGTYELEPEVVIAATDVSVDNTVPTVVQVEVKELTDDEGIAPASTRSP